MLFDYMTLQIIWWAIILLVLILYATTAGCDFGVTIMMPFMSKHKGFKENDVERRLALNTIAPTWDGNQTWIVIGGGALFGIWPAVYGTIFSGLYPALLLVLFTFFLRPPGFDYRSKLDGDGWRKFWDWGLFISSFIPVLIFGLVLGALFHGLPFYHDDFLLRSVYAGNAFASVLSPFAILCALLALSMVLMHACLHLNRRLAGELGLRFRRLSNLFILINLLLVTIGLIMLAYVIPGMIITDTPASLAFNTQVDVVTGGWLHNYALHPWMWLAPVLCYVMLLLAAITKEKNETIAYWCSALAITAILCSAAFALFPFVVPSNWVGAGGFGSQSLTIWNVSASEYSLMGMLYITFAFMVLIVVYKFWGFSAAWRGKSKLDKSDLEQNNHTFY
ncbi:cytochrome d ubiquinol oxidase subunit II [Cysteiniphilum sp. JM-1]|uniref:cytochrome d ubiquinol oxidase subunit II n=1 Tax=Cysteiniphilum sp. JM-1 TaxID=2610891 RepID=UPI001243D006|nr:cytochrome d ubiquinol oxidase subunit II [Cysteiniphilum sp. JM-1]